MDKQQIWQHHRKQTVLYTTVNSLKLSYSTMLAHSC